MSVRDEYEWQEIIVRLKNAGKEVLLWREEKLHTVKDAITS